MDGWIKFKAVPRIGVLVKELRNRLDVLLLDKMKYPKMQIASRSSPILFNPIQSELNLFAFCALIFAMSTVFFCLGRAG